MNYATLSCECNHSATFCLVAHFGFFPEKDSSVGGFTQSFSFPVTAKPTLYSSNSFNNNFFPLIAAGKSTTKFTINNNPHIEIQYLVEKESAWFIIDEQASYIKKGTGKTFRISIDDTNKIENLTHIMKSLKIYWLTCPR